MLASGERGRINTETAEDTERTEKKESNAETQRPRRPRRKEVNGMERKRRATSCCPSGDWKACSNGAQHAAPLRGNYSNFSVRAGTWSIALARDFSAVVLRDVAISLTRRYFARSSIFFSRKERGLLRLRETRLLRTTATSRRAPVRMRSEFSLKRCFQS